MSENICPACLGSGWVTFNRNIRGKNYPWAGACHCDLGSRLASSRQWPEHRDPKTTIGPPVVVQPVDRAIFNRKLDADDEPDHPNSTPERKRAALRYVVASFSLDPNPAAMVERILAGDADDVVRTIGGRA